MAKKRPKGKLNVGMFAITGAAAGVVTQKILAAQRAAVRLDASWATQANAMRAVPALIAAAAFFFRKKSRSVVDGIIAGVSFGYGYEYILKPIRGEHFLPAPSSSSSLPADGTGTQSTASRVVRFGNTPEDQILRANAPDMFREFETEERITADQMRLYERAWALLSEWSRLNGSTLWTGQLRTDIPTIQRVNAGVSPPDRPGRLDRRTQNAISTGFAETVRRGGIA